MAAYAIAGAVAGYHLNKMYKEIEAIERRTGGPQGYMYSLTALAAGDYPVMSRGYKNPTSMTPLNMHDVWKFGETSSKSKRYSDLELAAIGSGVVMNPLFYGNRVQIKVQEKLAIYGYFFTYGHLPPGNKIFR